VDAAIVAYFQGPALTLADLAEEERDRLAGKAPFLAWLEDQPAPASHVLFGIVIGMYLVTVLATAGPFSALSALAFRDAAAVLADSLLFPSHIALLQLGATFRPLIDQGELWRLVAANYLHANLLHLFVNAFSISMLGPTLEKIFGTPRFLAVWVVAGATGAAASAAVNREATSVGASGALFGLLGAMLVLGARFPGAIPSHQIRAIRHLALLMLGFNLVMGATVPRVDNMAHLGGLAGGLAMAFVLGPHPALSGRKRTFANWTLLWAFPLVAAAALATGLATSATGRMPEAPIVGPTRDYEVTLPIDAPVERVNQYLIARSPRGEHFVLVHSVPNPEGEPAPGRPAFTEATLDARVYEVARRYASQGARLVDRPAVVRGGHHRFLMIPVAMPEGAREEIHVTASPARIYAIRTRGLVADPWVREMRDRVLATFRMRTP
jgi:membrane associated rhomboid family serine protease